MTEAVTVLIPKEGDVHSPSNFRPITLLNVDYKLMTKTINKSFFSKFRNDNLSDEQLCAVPGRNFRNGTILIRDIISYCKSKGISASIVSLDQKKAFDMVDRCFLYKILKALKVNSRVLRFVDTIYCNTHTSIQVNGHLSSKIPLQDVPYLLHFMLSMFMLSYLIYPNLQIFLVFLFLEVNSVKCQHMLMTWFCFAKINMTKITYFPFLMRCLWPLVARSTKPRRTFFI